MSRGDGRVFLRKRSPFWWLSYCRNGKEVRESTEIPATEKNRKKAESRLKHRLGEIWAERHGDPAFIEPAQRRTSVDELLDALEQDYKARDKASPQFKSHLKRIREAFGSWRAVNLAATPEAIDKYINACKDAEIAPATINRSTQLLSQAYKLAIERKQLRSAPVIRHMPEKNTRHGFFEEADFKAVVGGLPEYLQDFARFGYICGWRKGEISSLLWADVDDSVIQLRAENSKDGRVAAFPSKMPMGS